MGAGIETARNPRTTPDMSKIAAMTETRLMVQKRVRGGARAVVHGIAFKNVDDVLSHYTTLPREYGPGIYQFDVFDPSGTEKDTWTVQLGVGGEDEAQDMGPGLSMGAVPPVLDGANLSAGKPTHIGNGYFLTVFPHDPTRGILTTPTRQLVDWEQGKPIPGLNASVSSTLPPGPPVGGGWGSYPAVGGGGGMGQPDPTVQLLKDQLEAERTARAEEAHRRELKEVESKFATLLAETNRRHEELLAKVTEAPKGLPPEVQARLEAAERAAAEAQRRSDEQAREAQRRSDEQARDERVRSEIQAMNQRFETLMREVSNNKQDPMMALLPTFMATLEKASSATQASMAQYINSISSRVMEPKEIMNLIAAAKDRSPDTALNKEYMEAMRGVFGMMMEAAKMQADMAPQGEPTWATLLKQGMDKIGNLGSTYMHVKAERDHQAEQQQRVENMRRQRAQQAAQAAKAAQGGAETAGAPAPGQPMTPDQQREAAAAHVFTSQAADEAVTPDEVIPPPPGDLPPGRTPEEANARLARASEAEIRQMCRNQTETEFFGLIEPKIHELRSQVAQRLMSPDDVADVVLQGGKALSDLGGHPVAALELLRAQQVVVLTEWLLPNADEAFREAVVEAFRARFGAEDEDEDQDGAA